MIQDFIQRHAESIASRSTFSSSCEIVCGQSVDAMGSATPTPGHRSRVRHVVSAVSMVFLAPFVAHACHSTCDSPGSCFLADLFVPFESSKMTSGGFTVPPVTI
jgi:hypothetical protein